MTDQPLPSSSPLDREAIAHVEVGHTAVSPAVARVLCVFFIAAILVVPLVEMAGTGAGDGQRTAWRRLAGAPARAATVFRAPAGGAAPSAWGRTIAANRSALADMTVFEDALEEVSVLGQTLRPPSQQVLTGVLGAGNERVYVGRGGWLFYRPDTEHVTGPGFLDPAVMNRRRLSASEWTTPPHADPRPAIADFARQLRDRGITLILMPTPVKPTIHPEQFSSRLANLRQPLQNDSYAAFIDDVRRSGVLVFDPAPLLAAAARSAPQYLERDTHWRPEAMEAMADALAGFIRDQVTLPDAAATTRMIDAPVEHAGDTVAMLDLPTGQRLYPPEQVWTRRILDDDGTPWRPSRPADVLVLGDSFSNIYSLGSLGWGESAGFVEHLSHALRRPVDRIVQNADGAWATRALLADAGPARLGGTRVVVWQFATRELSFGDWKPIDLSWQPRLPQR